MTIRKPGTPAILSVLAVTLLLLSGAGRAERYAFDPGADGAGDRFGTTWDSDGMAWQVRDGVLAGNSPWASTAVLAGTRTYGRLSVEATVIPRRPVADEWKIAAISVYLDDGNFWHLGLVEGPTRDGGRHFVELCEMMGGQWLSQNSLESTGLRGGDFDWQYDTPYRLRIEFTPEGITGTVATADGTEVGRLGYRFTAEAVISGRAALRVSGTAADFREVTVAMDDASATDLPPAEEATFPPYDVAGSGIKAGQAPTGFFALDKDAEGRDWFVDPRGERFYAVGTDHVNYYTHWCQELGYAPYNRNCEAKYGGIEPWSNEAVRRLKGWGFNLLGANNVPQVRYKGLAHTLFVAFGSTFSDASALVEKTTWTGFPNVFDPRWEAYCDSRARKECAGNRNDPWLLGYFLDNELEWYGKTYRPTGIWEATMAWPADHSGKLALLEHVRRAHGTLAEFRRVWGVDAASWDALRELERLDAPNDEARAVQESFLAEVADRYFRVTAAAIRKADPNHLIIGSRFAGDAPEWAWKACARYCDVVTFNNYPRIDFESGDLRDLEEVFKGYHALVDKPMMITEWSFPALDSGLPCKHGAGMRVDTQEQKARCFEVMQHLLFRLPFMIGSDYFMWADEPELGISDTFPEDSNYGLVNVNDEPYEELTAACMRLNPLAVDLHSGRIPEVYVRAVRPEAGKVVVEGETVSGDGVRAVLDLTVNGASSQAPLVVGAGPWTVPFEAELVPGANALTAQLRLPFARYPAGCRGRTALTRYVYVETAAREGLPVLAVNPTARDFPSSVLIVPVPPGGGTPEVRTPAGTLPAVRCGSETGAVLLPPIAAGQAVAGRVVAGTAPDTDGFPDGIRVERTPAGGFVIDNGVLRLEHDGSSGNVADRVLAGDVLLGSYNPLIWQAPGDDQWTAAESLSACRIRREGGAVVLEVTATGGAGRDVITAVDDEGQLAPRQSPAVHFKVTHRVMIFPGVPFVLARLVGLTNADPERDLVAKGYFFYLQSQIGGSRDGDVSGAGPDVPNYYRGTARSAWSDPGAGAEYGCKPLSGALSVNFWLDNGGGQHPDAREIFETAKVLKPGEVFAPADAPVLLIYGQADGTAPSASRAAVDAMLEACEGVVLGETSTP